MVSRPIIAIMLVSEETSLLEASSPVSKLKYTLGFFKDLIMPARITFAFNIPVVITAAFILPSANKALIKSPLYPVLECPKPPLFQRQTL